jgi:hypothetical protein
MDGERVPLETLDRKIAELASFLSPSEIFRALLEGTTAGSPRAAIFLLREGRFKGWSSIGYAAPAAVRQRQAILPAESGWLAALAAEDDVRWRTLTAEESAPDFGQGPYDEAVGLPVRVGGKAVAIVIAERAAGEAPWSPAALSLLCQAARLRLELDLAWRRLKSLTGSTSGQPRSQVSPGAASAAAPAEPISPTELTPWGEPAGGKDADPRHEEARRYARLVATDIRLYNEEAVVSGRKQRDLAGRLDEQMKRGREAFARRFPDMGADGAVLLQEAYVQVLAGGDSSLLR